jgi:nitrogen-specific signal transduction histidine kinase/ActR/RegA family two-component response regulator
VEGTRVIQCNIRDITRRKHAEEALRRSEEQLQQSSKLEAVGRLAGGVAHDFNNLLGVILGSSELLLEDLRPNDPRRQYVEAIATASKRAVNLTKQLLTFSRKQVSSPLVFDLNSIVRETCLMLPRVIGKHIEIGIVLSEELAPVRADPTQIQQILMNLAANARDAMPEGGKLTIEVANWEMKQGGSEPADVPPGHYVTLTVSDTGAGMSPDIQSRAFDPFFTTKDIGKGTGLGLSTVYGIVKESGGSILLDSERGEGTTFRIYLPRAKEEIIERAAASRVPDESLRGSETIFLVEDQSELRHLIHRFLQGLGYNALVAGLPEEAIEIAQQFTGKIDLLLTDVVMPGMNGRALAQQLRPLYANMRVLYMSGFADETLEQDVLDTNDAFMAKPFLLRELATKIRELFHEPKSACYPQKRQTRAS